MISEHFKIYHENSIFQNWILGKWKMEKYYLDCLENNYYYIWSFYDFDTFENLTMNYKEMKQYLLEKDLL